MCEKAEEKLTFLQIWPHAHVYQMLAVLLTAEYAQRQNFQELDADYVYINLSFPY